MYENFDIENLKRKNINLSNDAWKIIELDMNTFMDEKKQLSTFFNNVFTNFYQIAQASISIRTIEYQKKINNLIGTNKEIISKLTDDFVGTLITNIENNKIKSSHKKMDKNGKFKETKIKLNNLNYEILTTSLDVQHYYYKGKDRLYLNAIFEEYTKLNGFEREKIYFKKYVDLINVATSISKCKLKVQLTANNNKQGFSFILNPCGIYTEDTKSYAYIAGTKDSKEFVFRLNRIGKMSLEYSDKIEYDDLIGLDLKIKEKGIMYLSGKLNEYKVQLSEKGILLYNRTLNMRPQVQSIENNTYTFSCTEFQFENYFFKFGKECLVITPISMKEKFIESYKQALLQYEKESI